MKCLLAVCMGGASALAPRIARASLRVSDAAKAGAWYADCFGLSVRNTPGQHSPRLSQIASERSAALFSMRRRKTSLVVERAALDQFLYRRRRRGANRQRPRARDV